MSMLDLNGEASRESVQDDPRPTGVRPLSIAVAVGAAALAQIPELQPYTRGLFFGAGAGILAGLGPFFLARHRGQRRMAEAAVVTCTIAGAVLGLLLAGPVAAMFVVLSLALKRGAPKSGPITPTAART